MSSDDIARTFGGLGLIGLLLLFGLAPFDISIAVLIAIIYLAILVLIIYFRSRNNRD